jgi:hypothetical protein
MSPAGLAIYDTMQYVKCPVSTICLGQAASMGALLLARGHQGPRLALPNSRIMIHQPLGGARGQATDIEIQARRSSACAMSQPDPRQHTGQPIEKIALDTERDFYMTAREGVRPHRRGRHRARTRCRQGAESRTDAAALDGGRTTRPPLRFAPRGGHPRASRQTTATAT